MDTKVLIMGITRILYGILSFSGGVLILYLKDLPNAVKINAFMGSIGPFVFLGLSLLGIAGLATEIEPKKIIALLAGVALIMWGVK